MKYLLPVFLFFVAYSSHGQKAYQFAEKQVSQNGQTPSMPFAGGINAAQIQTMDATGNGEEELVIWDINSRNVKVFEQHEDGYTHLPYMHHYFPEDVSGFLILADYDGDGKKDLFTSSAFGIKAYKNVSSQGSTTPSWEVAENFLKLENGSNFQANNLDVPAIEDLDGDGDLDVVTFNFAVGDYLEFYRNTSVERNGTPGIDGFASPEVRWGNFEFCGCGNFSFGQTCNGDPISRKLPGNENNAIKHSGGHSILLKDFNNDGLLDMLIGQDECNTLYFLPNQGTNTAPVFTSFNTSLPGFGAFPQFPIFHVPQYFSGDLFISSNSSETSLTAGIDFSQSIYQLDENTNPKLITPAFLQQDMIDLGENSRPFIKGNSSGADLIVTANTIQDGQAVGQAYRYELDQQSIRLVETDYWNLSGLGLTELQYLEYINANQQTYWFVSGVTVEDFVLARKLYFSTTQGINGLQEISIPNVTLRANDHFNFYNIDGEDYMLLARQSGELLRYKVNFSNAPSFERLNEAYLGFTDAPSRRNLVVKTVSVNGNLDLYAVDQRGILHYLPNFINSNSPQSDLLTMPDGSRSTTKLGRNTWLAALPEVFGGKVHLILGNKGGGLQWLEDVSSGIDPPVDGQLQVSLYPNPSNGPVHLLASETGKARMINSLGQILIEEFSMEANVVQDIDVSTIASGIYFMQFTANSGERVTKKLIVR